MLTVDGQISMVGVLSGGVNVPRAPNNSLVASAQRGAAIFGEVMAHPWTRGMITTNPFVSSAGQQL